MLFRRLADLDAGIRRDARTQHVDHLAVDFHPAVDDPLIGLAPRAQAQFRHALRQTRLVRVGSRRLGRKHRVAGAILVEVTRLETVTHLAAAPRRIATLHLGFRRIALVFITLELATLYWPFSWRATVGCLGRARLAVMSMIALALRLGSDWRLDLLWRIGLRL